VNLTLSVDDRLIERAREVARRQGTSLNALVRQYIESLAGQRTPEEVARALGRLWKLGAGRSKGRRLRREDAYRGRL
jgi:hypothetical protein